MHSSVKMFVNNVITKHGSALYIVMAKVLPIVDVLGYVGQNFSFSSSSDSTPITQEGSYISTLHFVGM